MKEGKRRKESKVCQSCHKYIEFIISWCVKSRKKTGSIKIHTPKGQYMHVIYLMQNSASDVGSMNIYQDMYDMF